MSKKQESPAQILFRNELNTWLKTQNCNHSWEDIESVNPRVLEATNEGKTTYFVNDAKEQVFYLYDDKTLAEERVEKLTVKEVGYADQIKQDLIKKGTKIKEDGFQIVGVMSPNSETKEYYVFDHDNKKAWKAPDIERAKDQLKKIVNEGLQKKIEEKEGSIRAKLDRGKILTGDQYEKILRESIVETFSGLNVSYQTCKHDGKDLYIMIDPSAKPGEQVHQFSEEKDFNKYKSATEQFINEKKILEMEAKLSLKKENLSLSRSERSSTTEKQGKKKLEAKISATKDKIIDGKKELKKAFKEEMMVRMSSLKSSDQPSNVIDAEKERIKKEYKKKAKLVSLTFKEGVRNIKNKIKKVMPKGNSR